MADKQIAKDELDGFFQAMGDNRLDEFNSKKTETQVVDEPEKIEEPEGEPEKVVEKKDEFDFKSHFPDYNDIEDVKSALSKLKDVPDENDVKSWKDKAEQFDKHNSFIETLRNAGLNNDYLRLQILEAQKSGKVDNYKKMLFGNLSDVDLVKLDLIDQYPELKDDNEMLDFQLEEKYPQIFGKDADTESEDYDKAKKKMKFDANQVKKRLKSEFDSIDLPDVLNPDFAKNQQIKTLETWKSTFDSHVPELMTLTVDVDGMKEPFMDIKIPDNKVKEYKNAALMFIANNNLSYSKEALQKVKDFITAMYLTQNKAAYNKAILDKRAAMSDEQWRKFLHNPKSNESGKKVVASETDELDKFWGRETK